MKKFVCMTAVLILMFSLSACALSTGDSAEEVPTYTKAEGVTAVITGQTGLSGCYTFTYEGTDENGDPTKAEWVSLSDRLADLGDLVVVLAQGEEDSLVYVPTGDYPGVYGRVPNSKLSTDEEKIFEARQAMLGVEAQIYDAPHGTVTGTEAPGAVKILAREDGFFKIRALQNGSTTEGWVPKDYLVFSFDGEYIVPTDYAGQG